MLKVFIDLDGVLADFFTSVCWHFNLDPQLAITRVKPDENYIFTFAGNKENVLAFWNIVGNDPSFWLKMPPLKDGPTILNIATRYADQVGFLTSHSGYVKQGDEVPYPAIAAGKVLWVHKHYPSMSKRLILTRAKYLCACKDSVLLDDWDKQINEFRSAGGSAILIPRAWNSAPQVDDDYKWLERLLKILKEGNK